MPSAIRAGRRRRCTRRCRRRSRWRAKVVSPHCTTSETMLAFRSRPRRDGARHIGRKIAAASPAAPSQRRTPRLLAASAVRRAAPSSRDHIEQDVPLRAEDHQRVSQISGFSQNADQHDRRGEEQIGREGRKKLHDRWRGRRPAGAARSIRRSAPRSARRGRSAPAPAAR